MKGAFIVNNYYTDDGIEYVFVRLREELSRSGIYLQKIKCPIVEISQCGAFEGLSGFDFAVFWDKDTVAARALENGGLRLFNRASAIELCDDKAKTAVALLGKGVAMPATAIAPLTYDVNGGADESLLDAVEKLGYPIVVKENTGSQGRQVYLADDRDELRAIHDKLRHIPHLFQSYVADERGTDIRVYVVGGKAVAACKRRNTTGFKANVHEGGRAERFDPGEELLREAERIAVALGLDYGSVDFLSAKGAVFAEANSNAYFGAIERLGYDVAGAYARHIAAVMSGGAR